MAGVMRAGVSGDLSVSVHPDAGEGAGVSSLLRSARHVSATP